MSDFETQHFIGTTPIRPVNAKNIGFEFDWTRDIREAELSVDSIVLAGEAKQLVLNHIANRGIFEGLPYSVKIGNVSVDYYIDLTDSPKISGEGDSTIEVKIKRRKAVDYFKSQADGLTWDLVNSSVGIDTFDVPYLIIRDNQLELFIMLSIAGYQLTKALIEGIKELGEAAKDFLDTLPPSISNAGSVAALAIMLVARALYVAALIIALIKIVKDIVELVFPPLKEFKACTVYELFKRGCEKLGYTFHSTVSEFKNMTVVAKPVLCPKEGIFKTLFKFDSGTRTLGYPTAIAGDSYTTLGQLIEFGLDWCNGRMRIMNTNEVHIERRDHWVVNSGVTIRNTFNIQSKRENQWTYNTDEHWKRYFIKFALDPMDIHTFDNVAGNYSEHSTEPVSTTDPDLVLIKGLVRKELNFAMGSRKDGLNFIEQLFIPYAELGDSVINFFGGSSNLVSSINGRVGVLQISQQYFGVTKLLYTVNGKQPANFRDLIGGEQAYQKYHIINQVKENFKRIYEADIPFSTNDFENLLDSNYLIDSDGTPLEVLNFSFINESKVAQVRYAVLSNEGFNTKTILIDGGGTSGTTTTNITC